MHSVGFGVIVLDTCLAVRSWNGWCEATWGVPAAAAMGRAFLDLPLGLASEPLRADLARLLDAAATDALLLLDGADRHGGARRWQVRLAPFQYGEGPPDGVVLFVEDAAGRGPPP